MVLGNNIMNTKAVEEIYEAGHVLYAGKMSKNKRWSMDG